MNQSARGQEGISWGCAVATLIPILHSVVFFIIAWRLLPGGLPSGWGPWLRLLAGSIGLLLAYVLTLVVCVPIMVVLSLKDRDARGFLKKNWPIVMAVAYPFVAGWLIPTPIDEIIVAGMGTSLRIWFAIQSYILINTHRAELTEAQAAQLEAWVKNPASMPDAAKAALLASNKPAAALPAATAEAPVAEIQSPRSKEES